MSELFLSPAELAERYGVTVNTIYLWNHRGDGPAYLRLGKHVRYRIADVETWEDAQYKTSAPVRPGPKKTVRVAIAG